MSASTLGLRDGSYQRAVKLTHVGDSQTPDFLIHHSEQEEARDGDSGWGSIRLHIGRIASDFPSLR